MFRTALVLATLVVSVANAGQVYRWVDDDGKVHYSDHPRPQVEALAHDPDKLDAVVSALTDSDSGEGSGFGLDSDSDSHFDSDSNGDSDSDAGDQD